MSSSLNREPLAGVIRQNEKVVGSICLPEEDLQDFIDQFNHCYGPLQLHIDSPDLNATHHSLLIPVGASRARPFGQPQKSWPRASAGNADVREHGGTQ